MRWSRVPLALCIALLVATSLVPGAVAVADARTDGATSVSPRYDGTVAASQQANATITLNRTIFSLRSGESTTIELAFNGTDEATVVVGGDGAGDNVTATVTDSNGDGVVPIEFDAGSIGTMATRVYPVNDSDDYGTVNASEYGGLLPGGEYTIAVYVGHGVSGEPTDVGTLVVEEVTTETPGDTTPETTEPPETTAPPEASLAYDGDAVILHPRSDQVVAGSTSLDAGRQVTVRLRSSGDTPFLKSAQADVGDDGAFAVSFDMSDVAAPANATVVVTVDGDRVAGPVDAAVVEEQAGTSVTETSTPGQPGFGAVLAVVSMALAVALVGGWRTRG